MSQSLLAQKAERPQVLTFGCRLNAYESEVILRQAEAAGLTRAIIVNSCAVTAEAERQVRQAIRKARRENAEAEIIVTGCAVEIDRKRYEALPEVTRVLGNREKLALSSYLPEGPREEAPAPPPPLLSHFTQRRRAYLELQQGCDHRCTFCVIPLGRGPSRSVAPGEVVARARALVAGGVKEIVLTGVDLTAWGQDLPGKPSLGGMAARLLRLVPELPRLRLSSLDPAEVDEPLLALLAEEPRLMPHLHLSVQAGADLILKRMKRRHLRARVLTLAKRARQLRPDLVLGADFIAGFPTEGEAEFAQSLALVEEAEITWLHVFPFSERPGTPAARMPQVPGDERRERAVRLRALGQRQVARFLRNQLGKTAEVLVEEEGFGRSPQHAPVRLNGAAPGEIALVRFTAATERELRGEKA